MIKLINVSKSYPTHAGMLHALKNINLEVPTGDIFGIIGMSGAGKSTLIRCFNLLERPTQGIVEFKGQNLSQLTTNQLRTIRRQISMIFQHFNLLSQRTVYQNVALPLEFIKQSTHQIKDTVMPLLELTGLTDKMNSYPSELSGGQKQRVAIARALASKPTVLLCDEATSALDPYTTKSILQLLKDINQKLGLTIVLITHEVDVVKQICDRVALIHDGELIEEDSIFDFFTKPQTVLAKEFVKSSLKHELPFVLQQQLETKERDHSNILLRIIFHGKVASEPLVAHLMQNFGIKLNILQANIEFLKNDLLGIMVTEVMNNNEQLKDGIKYLEQQGVNVEILGYVNRNV